MDYGINQHCVVCGGDIQVAERVRCVDVVACRARARRGGVANTYTLARNLAGAIARSAR